MYEHLESLRPEYSRLFANLTPQNEEDLRSIRRAFPECPEEYLEFMRERGSGPLLDRGEHFVFEQRLLSAEKEYFQDLEIYEHGAKGDVWIFGWESMGTAYGFDSGDGRRIVEVDEYRLVVPLHLSFRNFAEGLLVCYPQIPTAYVDGVWKDHLQREYVPAGR